MVGAPGRGSFCLLYRLDCWMTRGTWPVCSINSADSQCLICEAGYHISHTHITHHIASPQPPADRRYLNNNRKCWFTLRPQILQYFVRQWLFTAKSSGTVPWVLLIETNLRLMDRLKFPQTEVRSLSDNHLFSCALILQKRANWRHPNSNVALDWDRCSHLCDTVPSLPSSHPPSSALSWESYKENENNLSLS